MRFIMWNVLNKSSKDENEQSRRGFDEAIVQHAVSFYVPFIFIPLSFNILYSL